MNLELVLGFIVGIVAGGVAALKVIAPKTNTKVDDVILEKLEALEALLKK